MTQKSWTAALVNHNICRPQDIRGCSEQEILALEHAHRHRFPPAYRQFLRELGHSAGRFLEGTDIFLPALNDLNAAAAALLRENGEDVVLPGDAYVFCMHQGYEFCYFRQSEGDDPPVYQYVEGQGAPGQAWPSFSAFVADAIQAHTRPAT